MKPLARWSQIRKAIRLYDSLARGETHLLVEYFPFVKAAFTPRVITPPPEPRKPLPPPRITLQTRSEEDELRDALDIGFDQLKFTPEDENE